jgi:hypothetical protein
VSPLETSSASNDTPRRRRPRPVTLVSWLFIGAGTLGLVYHGSDVAAAGQLGGEGAWVLLLRLLAVISGAWILRGANWARWLGIAWMVYHVVLSAFHSASETVAHVVLLAAIAYVLLRRDASAYFASASGHHEGSTR